MNATDPHAILGTGWAFPPRFSRGGEGVEMASGEEDIRESLHILLATSQGERIMREEYGCNLNDYLFEEIDQRLFLAIKNLVSSAIAHYEPRIEVEEVQVSQDQAISGQLEIHVSYRIRSTNSRYNYVYPFYLKESIQPI